MASVSGSRDGGACKVGNCASPSRYECPRCGIAFCSVACYRNHSSSCVEAFVAEDKSRLLHGLRATDAERAHMREVLRRLSAEDAQNGVSAEDHHAFPYFSNKAHGSDAVSDDEEIFWNESDSESEGDGLTMDSDGESEDERDEGDVQPNEPGWASDPVGREAEYDEETERLETLLEDIDQLDISFDEAFTRLPSALAEDFRKQAGDGRIARLVQIWQPWWLPVNTDGLKGEETSDAEPDTFGWPGAGPGGTRSMRPRSYRSQDLDISPEIAVSRASYLVLYSVVDILMSYCATMRKHNGDWQSSPSAAAQWLWQTSGALAVDSRHGSCAEAAESIAHRLADHRHAVEAASDASAILGYSAGVDAGVERAVAEARAILTAGKSKTACSKVTRAVVKKVGFLHAYILGLARDHCGKSRLDAVAQELTQWAELAIGREEQRKEIHAEAHRQSIHRKRTLPGNGIVEI